VLFFGVLGALVFRGVFFAVGVAVVNRFTAVLFAFAAVLFCSTYKILKE
jgi:tellurite resistance protein TerC